MVVVACAAAPGPSWAQDIVFPNPTNSLQDISFVPNIRRSRPLNSFVSFNAVSDHQLLLGANVSAVDSEAEATVFIDDPNTVEVETIPLSSLGSNGVFNVALRDSANTEPGVVTLFLDDSAGGSDFVFLYGVDATTRVWSVAHSLFTAVDANNIKDMAFVVFNGLVTNPAVSLNIYFRGHPYVPLISGTISTSFSMLAGAPLGSRTAFPPVAVSAEINGGMVTSLVGTVTNFIAGYQVTNLQSRVTVQIDRGTLEQAEFAGVGLDSTGYPRLQFAPMTGNLYKIETSSDLASWQTNVLFAATNGDVIATNAGTEAGYARISTTLFPMQNMGDGFMLQARLPTSSARCLVELVDDQGTVAPFWISGINAVRRYTLPNDTNALPMTFRTNAIESIRFTIPRNYTNYPSGLLITNTPSTGTFEIRFPGGLGPIAPPRS
jgi:hypothetical protein